YVGKGQPCAPRTLAPGIPGQSVDPPPADRRGRSHLGIIIQASQPDPYNFPFAGPAGGQQPYVPRWLSPGIPGQSVDRPPPDRRATETLHEIVGIHQPGPWGVPPRAPLFTPVRTDNPPVDSRRLARFHEAINASLERIERWPHYSRILQTPPTPTVVDPPFDRRNKDTLYRIVSDWRESVLWNYFYVIEQSTQLRIFTVGT